MKKRAKTFSVQAYGNSMWPLLQNRDDVEYIQVPFRAIRLNDIVLTYVNNTLVTHRVIYITRSTCVTRGDSNPTADTIMQKGRVLAKVVRFKRKGKWYGIQDIYLTQSALYLREIQKLETALQLKKIAHAFLKGVLVSLRYERAIPERIYADCDVLVKNGSYKQIKKLFLSLGYRPVPLADTDSIPYFKKLDQQPEVNFIKTVQGVPIVFDVHFEPVFLMSRLPALGLLYPNKLLRSLGDILISRSVAKKIKGFSYFLCCVPDQIIYLALHIFHHNYTDSLRYQLLDAVIRKGATKKIWDDVQDTIEEYHLEGYLYGVFILFKKYFKTSIPQSFFFAIQPSSFKRKVSSYFLKHVDIFSQGNRVNAGIERFILIFLLSPEPWHKKFLLFVQPEVLFTGFKLAWVLLVLRVSQVRHLLLKII